jgi:hypothetical protein
LTVLLTVSMVIAALALIGLSLSLSLRIVKQREQGTRGNVSFEGSCRCAPAY